MSATSFRKLITSKAFQRKLVKVFENSARRTSSQYKSRGVETPATSDDIKLSLYLLLEGHSNKVSNNFNDRSLTPLSCYKLTTDYFSNTVSYTTKVTQLLTLRSISIKHARDSFDQYTHTWVHSKDFDLNIAPYDFVPREIRSSFQSKLSFGFSLEVWKSEVQSPFKQQVSNSSLHDVFSNRNDFFSRYVKLISLLPHPCSLEYNSMRNPY